MLATHHVDCAFVFQVAAELPIDSEEADEEKKKAKACNSQPNPVLYIFGRGYASVQHKCNRSITNLLDLRFFHFENQIILITIISK